MEESGPSASWLSDTEPGCDMSWRFGGSQNRSSAAVTRNGPLIPAGCGPAAGHWAVPCVSKGKGKGHPRTGHEGPEG